MLGGSGTSHHSRTTPGLLSLQVLLIANLILPGCNSRWEPALSPQTAHFPWLQQALPLVWSCVMEQDGPQHVLGSSLGVCSGWSQETEIKSWAVSVCFFCPVLGVFQCVNAFHEWRLGFYSYQSHWFSSQLRAFGLLVLDPRGGLHKYVVCATHSQGRSLGLCNPPLLCSACQGPRSQTYHFSSCPIRLQCEFFLQPWLYEFCASLQSVFSENCSTCRCLFDVPMGKTLPK